MVGRVVEVATDGRHLSTQRGFLIVAERGEEVGRVPLDDIAAVIANAHGLTYSNNVLIDLPTRAGISPLMICAERMTQSLAKIYAGEGDKLELPLQLHALE